MKRVRRTKPHLISTAESLLDEAVALTFPASDPISVEHAYRVAKERDRHKEHGHEKRREKTRARSRYTGR